MRIPNVVILILTIFFSIIVSIFLFQSSRDTKTDESVLIEFDKISSSEIVEISNPVFKSKGLDTKSYIIEASRGIQNGDDIELYNIISEFEGENEKKYRVSAEKGFYNQQNETIELFKNVIIIDELYNKTSTKKALIDINEKKISLSEEVVSTSSNSSITSDYSIVDEVNNTITYFGNVKVKILNE